MTISEPQTAASSHVVNVDQATAWDGEEGEHWTEHATSNEGSPATAAQTTTACCLQTSGARRPSSSEVRRTGAATRPPNARQPGSTPGLPVRQASSSIVTQCAEALLEATSRHVLLVVLCEHQRPHSCDSRSRALACLPFVTCFPNWQRTVRSPLMVSTEHRSSRSMCTSCGQCCARIGDG